MAAVSLLKILCCKTNIKTHGMIDFKTWNKHKQWCK